MPVNKGTPSIQCRYCGCRMSTVTQTRKYDIVYQGKKRTILKRHRKCRHCGLQYNTVETYEDDDNPCFPDTAFPPPPVQGTKSYTSAVPAPSEKPGVYWPVAPAEPPAALPAQEPPTGPVLPPEKPARQGRGRKSKT